MNELWFTHEMNPGIVQPVQMPGLLWTGGASGDLIGVRILRSGAASDELDGKTVTGFLIRPDKQTVAISGTSAGGSVSVILPQEAYAYEGQCQLVIRVTSSGVKIPVFAGYATIGLTSTDEVIDPGSLLPDLEDLLAALDDIEDATAAAQAVVTDYQDDVARQDSAIAALDARADTLDARADTLDDKTAVTVERGNNRYIPRTRTIGKVVYTNGSLHDDSRYDTSDFIPVSEGETVMAMYWDTDANEWGAGTPFGNYAFYDETKTGLNIGGSSGLAWIYGTDPFVVDQGVDVPSGAAYIRFSIRKDVIDYAPLTAWLSDRFDYTEERDQYWNLRQEIARSADVTTEISSRIAQSERTVLSNLAHDFNSLTTYNYGDKVLKDNLLYMCSVDLHQGAWDDSHFTRIVAADYLHTLAITDTDGNVTIALV